MKEYCLGIDIGGTSVKYGLFDRNGELLEKWSSQTNTQENGRYIIIHSQTGELQRINKLHLSYMALQYSLLFPYGELI